jgi:hypothetical protein
VIAPIPWYRALLDCMVVGLLWYLRLECCSASGGVALHFGAETRNDNVERPLTQSKFVRVASLNG